MTLALISSIGSAATQSVEATELAMIKLMIEQWGARLRGNRERQLYYDQKNAFKDMNISTPPQLRGLEAVIGWAAKAVDAPADRITFERFVAPGVEDNPFGLDDLVADNDFQVEFSQAATSSMIHSCAFITVAQGFDGEAGPLWHTRSAEQATGLWDRSTRGLKAGLTVSIGDDGQPERIFAYFRDKTVELTPSRSGMKASVIPNLTGRIPMEVLRVKPDLKRPFGRSRITPAVMYFSDGGIRSIVRSEVGAEFFAAPQRYGIGIDDAAFDMDRWTAVTGRFLAVSKDEDGDLPQLGQFAQHSMQPHTDHLRMWAAQLSGESSIPIAELGFVADQPSSDPAIQSQRDPLRLIADKAIMTYRSALRNLAITTVMLRDGLNAAPDDLKRVSAWFAPTFRTADSAAADAALKQATVLPWIAESPVFLEKLNYTQPEIERLMSDKRRAGVSKLVEVLQGNAGAASSQQPAADELTQSQVLKAKSDALGVLRRAGVDADDAARLAGLDVKKFIPGQPITIKTADE